MCVVWFSRFPKYLPKHNNDNNNDNRVCLLALNFSIVALSAVWCVERQKKEQEMALWRKQLNAEDLAILNKIMPLARPAVPTMTLTARAKAAKAAPKAFTLQHVEEDDDAVEGKEKDNNRESIVESFVQEEHFNHEHHQSKMLAQYLLPAETVVLKTRVGAGSFGEVFQGLCLGQPVAVKTMLQVTEKNVKEFRAEVLLTASLRHPNVVSEAHLDCVCF